MSVDSSELDEMGPIDYLVVEFPPGRTAGEGLPLLVDLVDRGIIRILDLMLLRKEVEGGVTRLTVAELDEDARLNLAVFEGASSGLLGADEIDDAGAILEPGSTAGILVYENTWAAPVARAMRRNGGRMIANGRIPVQAILAALDDAESAAAT